MMKWKVVKNARCISADRSLECLRNKYPAPYISDNNNNEQPKQESSVQKESKQQDSSFTRKPSLVASDCINLKSFLGLTRQRSEINLSNLGLIGNETRRSRSEVRGISCDRLTIGYHTPSAPSVVNSQAGNSSPPNKSGCWLRGRKKERESRCPEKVRNNEVIGKTVVTGSNTKRTSSKSCDARTVADQSGGSKTKKPSIKLPSESRKSKSNKKGSCENLLDEDIYAEIGLIGHSKERSVKENKVAVKGPVKHKRKKGQAPKPQISNINVKENNCDVNLNPNGSETKEIGNCFIEKKNSPQVKPSRRIQSANVKNDEKHADNRTNQSAKINNLKSSEALLTVKNKINYDSNIQITVAEVHKNMANDFAIEKKKNLEDVLKFNPAENEKTFDSAECNANTKSTSNSNDEEYAKEKERSQEIEIEIPPYHIDTPDYSTLESVFENNQNEVSHDKYGGITNYKDGTIPDVETLNHTINAAFSDAIKANEENTISSILRDSSGENKYSETELISKKMVRFEKLDLIETYKKNKAESIKDSDEDSVISISEKKHSVKKILDINSNETTPYDLEKLKSESSISNETEIYEKLANSSSDCLSESSVTSTTETDYSTKDIVNVLIRNPSPESQLSNDTDETQLEDTQTQLVVKKSIVLTIAKQEKGFKSMCANKKPEIVKVEPPPKPDHKISVTILCSDSVENIPPPPPNIPPPRNISRVRSSSVSPENHLKIEVPPPLPPPLRGRSRERRSKDRQHCKKTHKSKKKNKEDAFHMPQAVIDELSQVLEKRKPSLDKKTPMQAS